ncbi:Cell surface protein [Halomicrobium sp. LC1Hm]|nr:Cell surface protein [Halomicrobium sp. LC1Hm]
MLVVAGVVVGLAPTVGLTTAGADRGVSVGTAPDGSALLALEPAGTTVTNPSETTVATLRNNAGEALNTAYSVSVDGDGGALTAVTAETPTNLDPNGGTDIAVKCKPNGQRGTAQLQVHVAEAAGDGVTIQNALLTVDVAYDCPGGGGRPSDRPAFDDADGDGEYDEGEETYSVEELENFENRSVRLAIKDAGTLDARGQRVSIEAREILIQNATLRSNKRVSLDATGAVTIDGEIESNKGIQIDAGGQMAADYAQLRSKRDVSLSASGSLLLRFATIDAKGAATATLQTQNGNLLVQGLSVRDDDDTLVYTPADASVSGTPSRGSVEAG